VTGVKVLADEQKDVHQEPVHREWAVAAAAVEPVRAALLGAARAAADRDVDAAHRYAADVLDTATTRVSEVHAAAVEAGRVEAAARTARTQAQARRDRRTAELHDQDAAYAQLRERVRAAVRALPASHPQLRERLVARALTELGPDARITDTPDGGLLAETPGRRLDLSLDALADLAVEALGAEASLLWTP